MKPAVKTTIKASDVTKALHLLADPACIETQLRFFKTGKGQYGEGDQFIGVKVPQMRALVKDFRGISLAEIVKLLKSRVHEHRLTALLLLVDAFQRAKKDEKTQELVVKTYLRHLSYVNNWDLVDSSAPKILGNWLLARERDVLYELVASDRLWTRRVAMVATQEIIAHGDGDDALALAALLLDDPEDLMHKASGWMLREVGEKVGLTALRTFLKEHSAHMPRTMLRYALEKLPEKEREKWMRS